SSSSSLSVSFALSTYSSILPSSKSTKLSPLASVPSSTTNLSAISHSLSEQFFPIVAPLPTIQLSIRALSRTTAPSRRTQPRTLAPLETLTPEPRTDFFTAACFPRTHSAPTTQSEEVIVPSSLHEGSTLRGSGT